MKRFSTRPILPGFILLAIAGILSVALFLSAKKQSSAEDTDARSLGQLSVSNTQLKIYTSNEGIYELDQADLQSFGVSEGGLQAANVELVNRGQKQNFWIDENEGKLRFYARVSDDRYSSENVYWLSLNPASVTNQESGDLIIATQSVRDVSMTPLQNYQAQFPPNTYAEATHLEENQVYNPLVNDGAPWLWSLLPAPAKKTIPVVIKQFTPGPGILRLMVWGSTEAATSPDHHLLIRINGVQIAEDAWDGKGRRLIEVEIPPGVLIKGDNQIEIELPGDLEAAADLVYLDWAEVIHPSPFIAVDDRADFVSPGGIIKLQGFSGPVEIYDITDPDQVSQLARDVDAEAGFDSQAGRRYWITGPDGYLTATRVDHAVLSPDLLSTENSADYLAIGSPDLLAAYQPLLDLRNQQGIIGMAVPVQAVYDQFSQGRTDPQAIRSLLGYARQHWTKSPKYLALIGDASYDPQGYQTPPDANQLPTFFVQTTHGGETASDYAFSIPGDSSWQTSNDQPTNLPAIAVGRIPARYPEQVEDYVKKVIAYEQKAGQLDLANPWQKRILAVADGSDPGFKSDAEKFLGNINDSFQTELLAQLSGEQGVNQAVSAKINQGNWLVAYFGHGSINLWGKDKIFTIQDIPGLENLDRLPVILNFTCLNGLFTHPKETSMAEAFLWQPKGGAVAVLAPTSLTLPEDQSYLSDSLAREIMTDTDAGLGELLTRARNQILAENPSDKDVLFTYLLFGDPALKLARPVNP